MCLVIMQAQKFDVAVVSCMNFFPPDAIVI